MNAAKHPLATAIATLGPVGHLPKVPGTWGSAVALLLAPICFVPLPLWARFCVLARTVPSGHLDFVKS